MKLEEAFLALKAGKRVAHEEYGEAYMSCGTMYWKKEFDEDDGFVQIDTDVLDDWSIIEEELEKEESEQSEIQLTFFPYALAHMLAGGKATLYDSDNGSIVFEEVYFDIEGQLRDNTGNAALLDERAEFTVACWELVCDE